MTNTQNNNTKGIKIHKTKSEQYYSKMDQVEFKEISFSKTCSTEHMTSTLLKTAL